MEIYLKEFSPFAKIIFSDGQRTYSSIYQYIVAEKARTYGHDRLAMWAHGEDNATLLVAINRKIESDWEWERVFPHVVKEAYRYALDQNEYLKMALGRSKVKGRIRMNEFPNNIVGKTLMDLREATYAAV